MKNQSCAEDLRKKLENYSYGLKDWIGKGYSSVVFKGSNDQTKETVAIKVVDLKTLTDATSQDLLRSQIAVIKKLRHENLLRCDNVFMTVNNCYIVTEFCNEGDLASLLKKKGRFREQEALDIIRDVFNGFKELGAKNVLHRDIKPANILLHSGCCKIADFGFAKYDTTPGQKQTYNVGTPLYMSPLALVENIYTIKNDIWSLGIMFYELVHGVVPWECRTEKELLQKIKTIPIQFKVKVSKEFEGLIRGCLEIEEQRRFDISQMNRYIEKMYCKENSFDRLSMMSRKHEQYKNQPLLKAHVNLTRFLFKLYGRLGPLECPSECKSFIGSFILNWLELSKLSLMNAITSPREAQIFGIRNFDRYSTTHFFRKISMIIREYNEKYTKFLNEKCGQMVFRVESLEKLYKKHLEKFKEKIGRIKLKADMDQNHLIAVDYLVSLVQMAELIVAEGMDFFAEHSMIELAAETQPTPLGQQEVQELISKRATILYIN